MTPEERLASVMTALESASVSCLVMGGHAVRFYGYARATNDFDLQVSPDQWDDLAERLGLARLFPGGAITEGPSWRPTAFRRFRIGKLSDGRDEWLEFWKENHLLPNYHLLHPNAERGIYGGRELEFLGLSDLIRSKETERESDWADVAILEQFLDARLLAHALAGRISLAAGLSGLRSRAGFEAYVERRLLADVAVVATALGAAALPVAQAFLIPFAPDAPRTPAVTPIEPLIVDRLQKAIPASSFHLSLVEVVRRRYIAFRKDVDRLNKESIRAGRVVD